MTDSAVQAHRVRRLHLSAPGRDLVIRGERLVRDAMGIASLPQAGARRCVYVRRLDVRQIRPGWSSATLALQIEQALALLPSPIPADSPGADDAPAVYFEAPEEAVFAAAAAIAARRPLSAWFWPVALPVWPLPAESGRALRLLLLHLADQAEAPAAVLGFVAELQARGALSRLLEALQPADGPRLLHATTGFAVPENSLGRAPGAPVTPAFSPAECGNGPLMGALRRMLDRWPAADVRLVWLALVAAADGSPLRSTSRDAVSRAFALIETVSALPGTARGGPRPHAPGAAASQSEIQARQTASSRLPEAKARFVASSEGAPEAPGDEAPAGTTGASPSVHESAGEGQAAGEPSGASAPAMAHSGFAGLFYVLNLLEQLRLADWLDENPALIGLDFPYQLLRHIGEAAGMAEDDPALTVMPHALDPAAPATVAEVDALSAGLARWAEACETWCRQQADGLTMASVVRRGGRLSATRTHLDIYFPLAGVDIRVRRAGFDINPGWLPWFGRVVTFWYLAEGETP